MRLLLFVALIVILAGLLLALGFLGGFSSPTFPTQEGGQFQGPQQEPPGGSEGSRSPDESFTPRDFIGPREEPTIIGPSSNPPNY